MIEKLEILSTCVECDSCRLICPENSIMPSKDSYIIDNWSCTSCGLCIEVCPVDCIKITKEKSK